MTVSGASNLSMTTRCSFCMSACFSASVFSLSRRPRHRLRRNLHLQPTQPHLGDAPWLLHQVAQRPVNLERVDGDQRRHVGSPLVAYHHARAADRHARKHAPLERLDCHFALELVGEERDDRSLSVSDRIGIEQHRQDDGDNGPDQGDQHPDPRAPRQLPVHPEHARRHKARRRATTSQARCGSRSRVDPYF